MKKDDSLYLKHILDSIKQIEEYIAGLNYNKFLQAKLIQDGVIRQLEIIGEATKNVSDSLKKSNPAVPWKDIAGMRDKLIHNYFGVDIQAVWETAKDDLPLLRQELLKIIDSLK